MSVKKFKFVSPGVFINEIDNSHLPATPVDVGPVVIGRLPRGPAMTPVQVDSFSDFVTVFGEPRPGGQGGDAWRDGNRMAPTYAAYAAQAWLRNSSPLTVVRLLGTEDPDTSAALGGQAGWVTDGTLADTDGGAYGLFLFNSGSTETGVLAAVWYCDQYAVHVSLSGSTRGGDNVQGSAVLIEAAGANQEFVAHVSSSNGTSEKVVFNFSSTSDKYIRKVFNTNPALCNSSITPGSQLEELWLGETYDRAINDASISDSAPVAGTSGVHGIILGLSHGQGVWGNLKGKKGTDGESLIDSQTGWFISQDLSIVTGSNNYDPNNDNSVTKLFKLHGLKHGEWVQNNLKVSVEDVRASTNDSDPYGTFNIVLRSIKDSDNAVKVVERFNNCSLNPNSSNYLAKKIGDINQVWLNDERRYRELGAYANQSKFMRVEMNATVDEGGTDPRLLPFGVHGPRKFQNFAIASGTLTSAKPANAMVTTAGLITPEKHAGSNPDNLELIVASVGPGDTATTEAWTGTFTYPQLALRVSGTDGNLASAKAAYWGYNSGKSASDTTFCRSCLDVVRSMPDGISSFASASASPTIVSWVFSLDDIKGAGANNAMYQSGSRAAGTSITALSGGYTSVLDLGYDSFTAPFFGGHDGLNIKESDPFRNSLLLNKSTVSDYAYASVKRAIDAIADPEIVQMNLATMPGLTNEALTTHLMNTCEDRGDALAIVDLKGGYEPASENASTEATRHSATAVTTTISNLLGRSLNNSYACAYFPWVRIQDTLNNSTLWAPPSVVALGTFSSVDRRADPWFAPAGFTRGGLTEGSAGIPVVGVRQRLTSKDRDKLYAANINPIASFPAEGIVIFGQKTLQVTPSALDRVNVRRLMLFVKRRISFMASRLLFEPNVRATWNRFHGQVEPFLRGVKARFGLDEFKVVLDSTTTTPDLIDRNIMYAKILLKPTRAIEFIAIDFVITNSGASFED